uniref:Uncharacterized protein LOC104237637 n=1 Tax=Nicotiana sylvestris TaxID=4096 RepID=A0A1U7XGW8_NICSY|nr:PREDICTED: uncharacterized protein LOC104237637 [Nicotiana sylvestris]
MEVYIDDMLVKSKKKEYHIDHLKEAFSILRQYDMKLNPKKCSFGIPSGKFLSFLVSQIGIEVNPNQIKTIEGIPEVLTNKKQVQKLTGRIAALLRFISRSSDRMHRGLKRTKGILVLTKAEPVKRLLVYLAVSKVVVLANFVADFSAKITPEVEHETSRTSPGSPALWILYTDGASNASGSGLGLEGILPPDKKEAKKLRIQVVRYNIINHDLYKRTFGGPLAKCLELNQTRRVLEEVHEGHCGAHTGNQALVRCLIRVGYYWPTMKKEATDYVKKCE